MAEYIDREAFIKDKRAWYCSACEKRQGMKRGRLQFVYEIGDAPCRACSVGDMLDDVEYYLAADVAPVVHAHWVLVPNSPGDVFAHYECSKCKNRELRDRTRYCPACGARMGEEVGK